MVAFCASGYSQVQNRLNVDDDIFNVYAKARVAYMSPENVALADSLHAVGVARGDDKILALALNLAVSGYFGGGDYDGMDAAMAELETVYERTPAISDIYFTASHQYCQYLVMTGRNEEAMRTASHILMLSGKSNNDFANMNANRAMAYVFESRNDLVRAAHFNKRALEYCGEGVSPLEAVTTNILIAREMTNCANLPEAKKYLDAASLHYTLSPNTEVLYYYAKAEYAYADDDYDSLSEYYEALVNHPYCSALLPEENLLGITAKNEIAKGLFKDAEAHIRGIGNDVIKNELLYLMFMKSGDFESAAETAAKVVNGKDSLAMAAQLNEIAMYEEGEKLHELEHETQQMHDRFVKILVSIVGALLFLGLILALIYSSMAKSRNLELMAINAELMTAREIAEDAFDQAKLSSEVESRFLQNMSHEIRTPLNAVLGFSQMLGLPDDFISVEERQEYSKFIADNAELLLTIIDDMISVADVERGEFKVRYSSAKVQEICVRAVKSVEHRVPAGVEFRLIDNLPPEFKVVTDVMRVHQVLVNILTNACKNTFKGTITMQMDLKDDGSTSICVTDTGIGIPPESIPFIFDRFYKVDPNVQGAGLGLHTSLAISRCLGAKLFLDANYTDGARFYLILPKRSV